jgi:dephospho-CoA kinase
MIVAVCREEQQIRRAIERDHLTREQVIERLHRQMPLAEKVKYADFIVDTSGTKESTVEQTRVVFASLRKLSLCDSES